ncbi:MAG: hypothetical protein K0R68_2079, partial [Mycobacterium sp.]|nr:hypothetical protein [Mycobacterium sp.]
MSCNTDPLVQTPSGYVSGRRDDYGEIY